MKPFAIACVVCAAMASALLAAPEVPDPRTLWKPIDNGQFTAACHVRYHNFKADYFASKDQWAKFLSLAVGVGSFVAPFMIRIAKLPTVTCRGEKVSIKKWADRVLIAVGCAGLGYALWLDTHPYNDLRAGHTVAMQRWNGLKSQWEHLKRDYPNLDYKQLDERIKELDQEKRAIEDLEPPVNDALRMHECMEEEYRFQNRKHPTPAEPKVASVPAPKD